MLTKKIYTDNTERYISYKINICNLDHEATYVIFSHGLMSNMEGAKAAYLEEFCYRNNYNFIKFDNFGHGNSSGEFITEHITSWYEGLQLIINKLTNNKKTILVGSSMGGWISLLAAMYHPFTKIIGVIGLAAAVDFTEELIWDYLSTGQQKEMVQNNLYYVPSRSVDCNDAYPISYDLILDGRKHLLLKQDVINITIPIILIHGMNDMSVPYDVSTRLMNKILSKDITLKLIKNGSHSLSRIQDLTTIGESIRCIASNSNNIP
ncbi:alpha/beta hydrolase [Rickettsia endosymbiont of Cardiosporidium cionae]|uniref:alpha/beta hydrolase n=1 Tax=Rickettsia endosymbiont of Cardiosporidium cionae TaxID=2777155 RepID=UPI0018959083|nr:alpha/beta hydrolase [Rickettsia endosymbiont of Cardiosporidium cionae]KAF8818594.1 alpha/beta hydrolase [Rickettsia endosymbiont of Cardiosporidium cionae]